MLLSNAPRTVKMRGLVLCPRQDEVVVLEVEGAAGLESPLESFSIRSLSQVGWAGV